MTLEVEKMPWGFWVLADKKILGGIVRASYVPEGPEFVTPDEFGLQVAVMFRPKGHEIPSHFHLPVPRSLVGTQEVILVQSGSMRADLFDPQSTYVASIIVGPGDLLILNSGGHGFEITESCVFFEVKQGPFSVDRDKEIFSNTVGTDTPIRVIE